MVTKKVVAPAPSVPSKKTENDDSKKKDKKVIKDKDVKDTKDVQKVNVKVENNEEKTKLQQLGDSINEFEKQIKAMKTLFKAVMKEDDKKEKILKKERDRKQKARESPSGFAKPTDISTEMCDFLKIPHGTQMSRTEVTKNINNYVSKNNLKDPVNGRIIRPDPVLKKLLRVKDGDEITFFHMQKLLNPHIKPFRESS